MSSRDRTDAEQLLRSLVQTNTSNPPGNEVSLAQLLARRMELAGLRVSLQTLGENRANVLGVVPGLNRSPALLYCGHLDTVPPGTGWHCDPFSADVMDGRMYGRGTVDMKSGLAAMVLAACVLVRDGVRLSGDLMVLGTAGEEVDKIGAMAFAEAGGLDRVRGIVIGEPTGLNLVTAHRGSLWVAITSVGKSAHGAMPDQGINAINHMSKLIMKLSRHQFECKEHPLLPNPTVNVGTIRGGVKTNMVPDLCVTTLDIRTLPGQISERVLCEIKEIVDGLRSEIPRLRVSVKVLRECGAVETAPEEKIVCAVIRAGERALARQLVPSGAAYTTDASVLTAPHRIPAVVIGPGDETLAHQPDENVELGQFHAAVRLYIALAQEYLG